MNSEYNKKNNRHPTEYCTGKANNHTYMARNNGLHGLNCTCMIENNTHQREYNGNNIKIIGVFHPLGTSYPSGTSCHMLDHTFVLLLISLTKCFIVSHLSAFFIEHFYLFLFDFIIFLSHQREHLRGVHVQIPN